ncbi:uncharacterized protein LOC133888122 isoform X2 [Phragmites australis]|uniref:uncharacterized protein LOC133888122 isoform X2 n=1 Tax=Phragmites australis TaxID=29695 RepID=UPI002D7A1BD9|nr:uncharacterized protein LOC133888122 isoform X2 [Phragmites australis]
MHLVRRVKGGPLFSSPIFFALRRLPAVSASVRAGHVSVQIQPFFHGSCASLPPSAGVLIVLVSPRLRWSGDPSGLMAAPPNGGPSASPMVMYPICVTGAFPQQAGDDQAQGPGIYAIQQNQLAAAMGMGCYAPTTLIALTYKIPTVGAPAGEEHGQDARQQNGPQRQVVVRRFHFAFQLDLALIIKLAAVVFLFSQEGSKQRLFLLILFASLIYLYQTGAITPFLRWLQRAGGAAARPPQAPPRVENRAPLAAQNDGNDQPHDPANLDQAAENQEPGAAAGNENQQVGAEGEGNRRNWLGGILKEVQLVVVGFVASLLPGFQHND